MEIKNIFQKLSINNNLHKPGNYSYTADVIRVIAIMMVLAIHVFGTIIYYKNYFGSSIWWFANIINSIAQISVPLFVMLSGYLLLSSSKSYGVGEFYKRRIKRIGVPYIAWAIIYLILQYGFLRERFSFPDVLSRVINGSAYFHLYFVNIILGLYLITPVLKKFISSTSSNIQRYILAGLFSGVFLIYLINYILRPAVDPFDGLGIFIPYIPYYLAGYYLRNIKISKRAFYLSSIFVVVLISLTTILNYKNMQAFGWVNVFSPRGGFDYFYQHFSLNVILMSLLGFVLLHNMPSLFSKIRTPLLKKSVFFVAPLVFGIYLIHPLLIVFIERVLKDHGLLYFQGELVWALSFLKFVIVFLISGSIVYFGKKIKYINNIFG